MSEEVLSVFSPMTQLASNMSKMHTKRPLRHTPTSRHCPYPNPSLTPTSSGHSPPSSGIEPTQQRNCGPGKIVAETGSRKKALKSSSKDQRSNSSPVSRRAKNQTPTKSFLQNQQDPWNASTAEQMNKTPLTSLPGGRSSGRRSSVKCKLSESMDQENIPPEGFHPNPIVNLKARFGGNHGSNYGSNHGIKNFAIGTVRKPETGFEDKILSPISSSHSKRSSSGNESNCDNESIPLKKMRSETRMRLFESAIAEADEFEAIAFFDDRCKLGVEEGQPEFNRSYCSQLNYSAESSMIGIESGRISAESSMISIESGRIGAESMSWGAGFASPLSGSSTSFVSEPSSSFQSPDSCHDDSLAKIEAHWMMQERPDSTVLPLVKGRRHDCNSISVQTLRKVMDGDYNNLFDEYVIVDCRYPYEYEGGHVKDAINLYTREGIDSRFMTGKVDKLHKSALIFHCEFSSERGPRLMQHLRNVDRQANMETYPSLYYPEVYLLDGGYKAFFEAFPFLCEPMDYKPMTHVDHAHELRHFKAKSKSWAAGDRRNGSVKTCKTKGVSSSRRRCLLGESVMEVDEPLVEKKTRVLPPSRLKKNARVLFPTYRSEGNCQEGLDWP